MRRSGKKRKVGQKWQVYVKACCKRVKLFSQACLVSQGKLRKQQLREVNTRVLRERERVVGERVGERERE